MKKLEIMAAKSSMIDSGKWLSFITHSQDTAGIMSELFERMSDHEKEYLASGLYPESTYDESIRKTKNLCVLAALLHDIGKLTPAFQCRIIDRIVGYRSLLLNHEIDINGIGECEKSHHSIAGQAILQELGFSEQFSYIIGSHHGKSAESDDQIECYPENYYGLDSSQKNEWTALWTEWVDNSVKQCGFLSAADVSVPDVRLQMLITALLIMSDWIASNTEYFPLVDVFEQPDEKKRIDYAWNAVGMSGVWCAGSPYLSKEMFMYDFGFQPHPFQQEIMNIADNVSAPGIYIIEAPMGLGKTEAALATAEILAGKFGCGGLYFGLPTQATANGIFSRICRWAECQKDGEKHSIRLAHGATDLNDEYGGLFHGTANDISDEDGLFVHSWFESRKRALLADFVVATVDQFLMASLKQKHVMLRHLGLAGKIVIIDECHAYDAYMSVYLDRTLTWMGAYKVPVIILSATLPPLRKTELIKAYLNTKKDIVLKGDSNAYPVATWTDDNEIFCQPLNREGGNKTISIIRISQEELTGCLATRLAEGGCAAVIVNTVSKAQEISRSLSRELDGFEIICFHSRFTMTDRADIENSLLERVGKKSEPESRNRLIVVGTQVIEQSLDLDFDFMVTELCPMDLLLQRSGRLHRHERIRPKGLDNACLVVMQTDMRASEYIYTKWLLTRTNDYLPDKLEIPSCIPELVGKVYSEPENKNDPEWIEYRIKIDDKKTNANKYCIKSNLINSRRISLNKLLDDDVGNDAAAEASVRDGDETIEVLLLQNGTDGNYRFLPWRNGGAGLDTTSALSDAETAAVTRERLKLPVGFSKNGNFGKTINALLAVPERWRSCGTLQGELLLLLDKEAHAEIAGKKLCYSREYGLEELKEG